MKQIAIAVLILSTLFSTASEAAESPYRDALGVFSRSGSFSTTNAKIYQRVAPVDDEVQRDRLLARLDASDLVVASRRPGTRKIETRHGKAWVEGPGWAIHVNEGGDTLRFRDLEGWDAADVPKVPFEKLDALSGHLALAEQAVAELLPDFVKLSETDKLRHWYTTYRRHSVRNTSGTLVEDAIDLVKVVFTRELDGIPVLGNGSQVSILLDVEGKVVGFDANWPTLVKLTEVEKGADVALVRERQLQLVGSEGISREQKFECGYYDSGRRYVSSKIRLACLVTERSTPTAAPRVYAIPAAEIIPNESGWAEAAELLR